MGITVINSMDEFNVVINSSRSNVIDFWATGSGPCQEISPVFEELSEDVHQVGFYRVDFDKHPDIAQGVGIHVTPTFIFYKNGQKMKQLARIDPVALKGLVYTAMCTH